MINIIYNGSTKNVPAPTVFEATLNTQQKSAERNAKGTLVREPLPDKWTLKLEWEFRTPEECYEWFNYLSSLTKVNFFVKFPAPTGDFLTKTFYISPITAKMLNYSRGVAGWWKHMSCSFIEV